MKKGFKRPPRSKEWCDKIREAHKRNGIVPPSRKGAVMSLNTRIKIGEFQKGRVRSQDTRDKIGETKKGDRNWSWKGGVSPEHLKIRHSAKYRNWRKAVFKRDNYICVECKIKTSYIEADHIKPFATFPELRFELSNGRTLCKPCHFKTETYGRPKKSK